MEDLSNKTVLVYDNGAWVELAARLTTDFGRVLYYSPWKCAFPRSASIAVGDGIDGVQRVANFWDVADEVDLFVFADVYDGDLQRQLKRMNKRVWGSCNGEALELDRPGARLLFDAVGLPCPPSLSIIGTNALRCFLRGAPDCYVKTSAFHDDMETFHHESWPQTEPFLAWLEARLGKLKDRIEFLVEEPIPGIEVGYDGWCIDGRWPEIAMYGYEVKDKGYLGCVCPQTEMPAPIRLVQDKLAEVLAQLEVRGFVSLEIRVAEDGTPYLIDPCMRCGSPVSELTMEMVANLPQVLWEGSAGNAIRPEFVAPFGAIAAMHCQWALQNWVPITVDVEDLDDPESIENAVKVKNLTVIDGQLYHVPLTTNMPEIGAVVGYGDSIEAAAARVAEAADRVHGYQLDIKVDALADGAEEIEKGRSVGIPFERMQVVLPAEMPGEET